MSRRERKALQKKKLLKKTIRRKIVILIAVLTSTSAIVIQGKLGFKKSIKDNDFSAKAKAIREALFLDASGYYSSPPWADMDLLKSLIDAFDAAILNCNLRVLGAGGALKTAKNNLYGCLKNALNFVNSLAWNNQPAAEGIIQGAKMALKMNKGKKKQELSVSSTSATGEALLQCIAFNIDGKYYVATYNWQKSIDGGATWVDLPDTSKAKLLLKGLTVGSVPKFRKRTNSTKGGITAWCTPIDFTVK